MSGPQIDRVITPLFRPGSTAGQEKVSQLTNLAGRTQDWPVTTDSPASHVLSHFAHSLPLAWILLSMSLRNMNIAPRALLGFALIGLLMLGLGIFSLVQMGNIRQAGVAIEQVSVPSIKILDEITALNLRMRTLSYRLLTNREPAIQSDTLNLLAQRNSQIDRARQAYLPMIGAADEQAAFDQYGQLLEQYRQLESRMRSLSQADRVDELRDLLNRDLLANSEQINKVMDTLVRINTDQTPPLMRKPPANTLRPLPWLSACWLPPPC